MTQKSIELIFHNLGLRSYIEVDLCRECPRQDGKGCCGYYSPVFYPTDFAYLLQKAPDLLTKILNIKDKTVLDSSITINNSIDGASYLCQFHSREKGCLLNQEQRESICRHFVCPGIGWEKEVNLKHWKDFFSSLTDYEIQLNERIAQRLKTKGLTLRNIEHHAEFFSLLLACFEEETHLLPFPAHTCPDMEKVCLIRDINFEQEWPL